MLRSHWHPTCRQAGWLLGRKTGVCSLPEIFPLSVVFEERKKGKNSIHFNRQKVDILSVIWMLMKLSILARIVGNVLPVLHQPLCCLTCCKCNKPTWKHSSTVCTDFLVWVFSHAGAVLGQESSLPGSNSQCLRRSEYVSKFEASPAMDTLTPSGQPAGRQWGEEEHGWQSRMH